MNADPEQGQPTTVPDPTASAKTPPEKTPPEAAESETAETETAESDAESTEPESVDSETTETEATAETSEPEPAEREIAEPEPEPEASPEPLDLEEPDFLDPDPVVPTPRAASTPLVAGRYRLVSEIGGGAMGVVWRARDEVLGRDVAVKELRPDHGMSGAQVRTSHQRARREGRIAARLQHPNAVVIYDVAEHDGRPYLIMEYVPSQSLGDILATGAVLTPTEVTSIGAQLASALTAAHERGIVHRDIKPGNVLMTADGTVKLTDFGISRAAGDATVTATGEILGTPAYTAPEVAQGHPVAFPADVFSLGATLYAAVEGTPPFGEDHNAMATLLRVVRNEIRLPKRSGPLTDTIMRMLSPEPVDRPTMKQVWQGLDAQSFKPLPVADIRVSAPVTKAFEAPSPTLVVTDPLSAKRMAASSEAAPKAPSAAATPTATPAPVLEPLPTPTPTPSSISSRVTAPNAPSNPAPTSPPTVPPTTRPTPASTPATSPSPTASSSAIQGATPTSAMTAPPTRDTAKSAPAPALAAAKSVAKTPPPPTSDRPATNPTSPPPERRSRSRMPLAIAICVVGTAVLIAAIVVAMNSGGSSPNQPVAHGSTTSKQSTPTTSTTSSGQAAAPSGTPSGPSTTGSTAPSTSATTSSSSPTSSASTPSTAPTDVATQLSTFVTNYYGLLPGNLNAAWPQMTAAYQTNVARGFSNYQSFWNGYQQVTISDVVATPPSTVVATIHYVGKDGTHTDERTSFGLVKDGNSWKIDTSHVIG
ncbi:serine/threonine protein kinase [Catenulispora sp. GAS73]|uniref:serine/threonine-protein kinase n=1 Tax=Catenulispora sp. GAS73 TaxID=3156269 RepID=UPI0035185420